MGPVPNLVKYHKVIICTEYQGLKLNEMCALSFEDLRDTKTYMFNYINPLYIDGLVHPSRYTYSGWTYDKISKPGRTSAPEDF